MNIHSLFEYRDGFDCAAGLDNVKPRLLEGFGDRPPQQNLILDNEHEGSSAGWMLHDVASSAISQNAPVCPLSRADALHPVARIPDKVGVMGTNNEFRRSFRPLRQVYGRSEVFFLIGDPAPVARNGRGFVVQRTYGGRGRE
jgi:hypothetical protein